MAWSKSKNSAGDSGEDRRRTDEASEERSDTKQFVAEMDTKLSDFTGRLEQRRHELALAQADIAELERLIDATKQALDLARPKDNRIATMVVSDRSPSKSESNLASIR